MPESEVERLKKLREKQLRDRDPHIGERKFQRTMSAKEKRMQKPISLADDWKNVPNVVKVPVYVIVLGGIATAVLVRMWSWQYAMYAGLGVTILLAIFGAVLGNALDLRDDIKKHLNK